jgi:hypothetical protein
MEFASLVYDDRLFSIHQASERPSGPRTLLGEIMLNRLPPYYFVCGCCGAKWFEPEATANCVRCGRLCHSHERIVPPWQANDAQVAPKQTALTDANLAELREQQYRTAYHEQLRRMACPGCGEGEPLF